MCLEELGKRFPDFPAYSREYWDFYDDYVLVDKEGSHYMKRGTGLGKANTLGTLIQLAIHNLTCYECHVNENIDPNTYNCLVNNDDFVVGAIGDREDNHLMISYCENDWNVCEKLGRPIKKTKCFFSYWGFQFCETYYNILNRSMNNRSIHYRRSTKNALCCESIVRAKELMACITSIKDNIPPKYIEEAVEYWGYEFFKEEIVAPATLGGWWDDTILGVSQTLMYLSKNGFPSKNGILGSRITDLRFPKKEPIL